jgi:hypothetical protein
VDDRALEPRATLVIPLLRQRDDWLEQCVASALTQSVPCQVVVVTSPLTPRSNLDALDRLAARHRGLEVVERAPAMRFAGALNLGFARARCERVGLLLSDDWLAPDAVETALPIDADIVSSSARVYDADGVTRLVDLDRTRRRAALATAPSLERKAQYLGHFLLFSRTAVAQAGGVDETVGDSPGVDDYHLLWTMLERGATAAIVERPLYNYRDHEGERLTNRKPLEMLATMSRILEKHVGTGEEHERLLAWHARWFGQPLGQSITTAARAVHWAPSPIPSTARADDLDARVELCLRHIREPATLDEHARRLAAQGLVPESTALAAVTEAACRGHLVRSQARTRTLPASGAPIDRAVGPSVPTTLAVVACGDPELAGRAVAGWQNHLCAHGHACRVIVADDSRADTDRSAIAEIARRRGVDYFGHAEKSILAAELATAADVPIELLHFAMLDPLGSGYTLGANLNAMLLATAGEAVLSVDQDVECRVAAPPRRPGIAVAAGDGPGRLRFYVDDDEARAWASECDVIAAHGHWLGRPVAARIGGVPATIVGSWMGVLGALGFADAASEVLLHGADTLRTDERRLAAVLARPRALRCPDEVTLADGSGFTSSTIGLDNRVLLPPFFPIGRGIDLLFGRVTGVCRPGAMFAHLPFALAHDRPTAQRDAAGGASSMLFVLSSLLACMQTTSDDPAERMLELGGGFTNASRLPLPALVELVHRIECTGRRLRHQRFVGELRACPGASAAWRHEMEARIVELARVPEHAMPPRELDACARPEARWECLQRVLRLWGALLVAWPRIVAAARGRRR